MKMLVQLPKWAYREKRRRRRKRKKAMQDYKGK